MFPSKLAGWLMPLLGLTAVFGQAQDFSQTRAAQAQAVLDRARAQIDKTIDSLPRYICIENVEREYLHPPKPLLPDINSCPTIEGGLGPNLRLRATDRVRLEVAVSDGGEIDSWPEASQFDTRGIDIIQRGPISSGAFGTNLAGVFQNPGAKIEFTRAETRDGRTVFVYRYQVPVEASQHMVRLLDGTRWRTGYSGNLEIAADLAELIRLTIETDRLPPYSGICRARSVNTYHHLKIGNGEFLIPVTSTFETVFLDGTATASTTTFSGCHEYAVETTIRFDAGETVAEEPPAPIVQIKPLPPAIRLGLRLDSPIDTEKAAAGDVVWARIERPDRDRKRPSQVPEGMRVRGRIMRAMHSLSEERGFEIEITFDAMGDTNPVAFAGMALPKKPRLPKPTGRGVKLSVRETPTGGVFKIRTKLKNVVLPAGTRFEWITSALAPPVT